MFKIKYDLAIFWPGYAFYNYHFFDEINKLAKKGYRIKVIFIRGIREDSNFYKDHIINNNLNIISYNAKGIRINDYNLKESLKLFFFIFKTILASRRVFTSTQAPLHSKFSFFISKLLRKKAAVLIEQWDDYNAKGFLMNIYKKMGYYIIKKADTLFVHGKSQQKFAIDFLNRKNKNTYILPFLSRNSKKVSNYDNKSRTVRILYFGRITERKGLDILIQAFKKIKINKKVELIVCGGIDKKFYWEIRESEKYFNFCEKLADGDPRIVFKGQILPKEKDKYFLNSDIFVHPHKVFKDKTEGWGLVLNEAVSYGLPIITTTKVGSASTLVHNNKNGFVIEPSNINELKNKLETLVENDTLRKKFSLASLEIFNDYHQPARIQELINNFISK